jgi:hypothetical protein
VIAIPTPNKTIIAILYSFQYEMKLPIKYGKAIIENITWGVNIHKKKGCTIKQVIEEINNSISELVFR